MMSPVRRAVLAGEACLLLLATVLLTRELAFHSAFQQLVVGDELPANLATPDEVFGLPSDSGDARTILWRGTALPVRWWVDVNKGQRVLRKGASSWLAGGAALSEDPPEPLHTSLLRFGFVIASVDLLFLGWRRWRSARRRRGATSASA